MLRDPGKPNVDICKRIVAMVKFILEIIMCYELFNVRSMAIKGLFTKIRR